MFRRFMIVCWILFAIPAVASLIGYVGYRANEEPTATIRPLGPDEEIIPIEEMTLEERLAQAQARLQRRRESADRSDRREKFLLVAWAGGISAGVLLLWNIIWHTAHWVWMGRKEEH